jgi:hypothetical protein
VRFDVMKKETGRSDDGLGERLASKAIDLVRRELAPTDEARIVRIDSIEIHAFGLLQRVHAGDLGELAAAQLLADQILGEIARGMVAVSEAVRRAIPTRDQYVQSAMDNLSRTSRTAKGTIDTSASAGKADKVVQGKSEAEIAAQATSNYRKVVEGLYDQRNRAFKSTDDLREFVEGTARSVNEGILAKGFYRDEDSPKYPYTRMKDFQAAMSQFYGELLARLNDPHQDPQELAAWVEYRMDLTDHFFADGCGKTSKAISAWTLMRNNTPLGRFPEDRKALFANAPTIVKGTDPEKEREQYERWVRWYRTLFEGA